MILALVIVKNFKTGNLKRMIAKKSWQWPLIFSEVLKSSLCWTQIILSGWSYNCLIVITESQTVFHKRQEDLRNGEGIQFFSSLYFVSLLYPNRQQELIFSLEHNSVCCHIFACNSELIGPLKRPKFNGFFFSHSDGLQTLREKFK